MALNTATSIVDYLKSKGLASDFATRKGLFEKAGLTPQQGEFRGFGGENIALLNYLSNAERKAGVSLTPDNLSRVISATTVPQVPVVSPTTTIPLVTSVKGIGPVKSGEEYGRMLVASPYIPPVTPAPTTPPTSVKGMGPVKSGEEYGRMLQATEVQKQLEEKIGQARSAIEAGYIPGTPTGGLQIPEEVLAKQPTQPIVPAPQPVQAQSTIPPEIQERINALTKTPTAEELAQKAIEQVQGGATFPLQQEASQAEKDALKLQQQSKTEQFIQQMASKGLTFSGIREKGVSTIEADTLSKMLGVDRKFALLIAQGLESAAQQIAKEAQKGSQDALQSLRALGYDINPLTNRVEPTLAAKQAEATQQRFEVQEARLQENARVQQERFNAQQSLKEAQFTASKAKTTEQLRQANIRIQQAEERIRQAEERLQIQSAMGMNYGAFNLPAPVK